MALVDYRDILGKVIVGVSVPAVLGLGALMASRWGNAVAYSAGSQHMAFLNTCLSIFFVICGATALVLFTRIAYRYLADSTGSATFDPWDLILLAIGLSLLVGGIMYFIDIFTYLPPRPRTPTPTPFNFPRISPTRIFTPTTTIRWPS
ncbi:hypothetical protein [Mycobacterium sp. NPDC050853]|uniref:hypothetical protein n=1 Tax=Mycobacteriaceae TaxID=1762 RepID=UPI0015DDE2B2|nr:hypothetical protein [Mycobacteroides sp. LB1]